MGRKELVYKDSKFGLAFCFMGVSAFYCSAQDSTVVRRGLLRAAGTFAFGSMPQYNISNDYLTGNVDYYAENKISVRGDMYYFVTSNSQNSPLKKNDALYFGAFYHFGHSNFDPLIGLQPGISYTQMAVEGNPDVPTICPLFSLVGGLNFFGEKWFHIQANVRYTVGEHLTGADESNISEISFNFGLGFNINVLKKEK